ncbi:MAG: ATP-dependent helicase, partial [Salinibacterium sp.]
SGEGTIEELLWIAWERSGLAKTWHELALGRGVTADEADRNLDGIVALFTAAKRFVERRPDASPATFLTEVLDADVPEDTLSPRSGDDAVLITTPSGVVGLEFDTVVVAGLQEGTWPNLRLRGSLLAPQELVRIVTGVESNAIDERRQVLGDELRMFALAISRARQHLVVAAVLSEEYAGSPFLGLVPTSARQIDATRVRPLSLRGLVGELRRELVQEAAPDAASSLAALAAESVPGANPDEWHGLLPISSIGPLFEGQRVPVSPSVLEKLIESPLDWFLERMAGSDAGLHAKVGTIVHAAMETAADSSVEAIWAVIESRWNELLFDAPWLAENQRRIVRRFAEAISEYLGEFERDNKVLVGAESHFVLEVGEADLRGTIDRVERSADGAVVIVDLKTGSPVTSPAKIEAHPQLGAYQLAYAEGLLDEALESLGEHRGEGAKLLFVKQGVRGRKFREGIQVQFTAEQLESFRVRVRDAAMLIAAAEFAGKAELEDWGRGDTSRLKLHRVRAVSSD